MSLDHPARLALTLATLDGLSVGDALGESLGYQPQRVRELQDFSLFRPGSVCFTDDTAMALGIVECLERCRSIDEDALAWIFADHFRAEPDRGYGKMARRILTRLAAGEPWQKVSPEAFGGGSFGNGAAMRVGPLGAYFHENPRVVGEQAAKSARVTHAHPEGIAGAIAVALACAVATALRALPAAQAAEEIWRVVLASTPAGATARGLQTARALSADARPADAARTLGCGYDVSCQDTVPFALWNACRCLGDFREALLSTIEVGGDCDTNAAIVGGIVASHGGRESVPAEWLRVREILPAGP